LYGADPLLAAGGPVTFVATKVTQKAVSRNAYFAAHSLCPANLTEPRAAIILPYFVPSFPYASAKTCYALAAAQAPIVLPAFVRSLSADGEENSVIH